MFKEFNLRSCFGDVTHYKFQHKNYINQVFVDRLTLSEELYGHNGCVNCLEWNNKGNLLASGSDDFNVIVWNPFKSHYDEDNDSFSNILHVIKTGHVGNIFSVKFIPNFDNLIATGAADRQVKIFDLNYHTHLKPLNESYISSDTISSRLKYKHTILKSYNCHSGRVKKLCISSSEPSLLWSVGEDGYVMQYDIRLPQCLTHSQNVPSNDLQSDVNLMINSTSSSDNTACCENCLLNLNIYSQKSKSPTNFSSTRLDRQHNNNSNTQQQLPNNMGWSSFYQDYTIEGKSLALNPTRPEMMAVGCNDPYVRIFDRRYLALPTHEILAVHTQEVDDLFDNVPLSACRYVIPGHVPYKFREYRKKFRCLTCTSLAFSPDGSELLVNLGGEQIYLFDTTFLFKPKTLMSHNQNLEDNLESNHSYSFTDSPIYDTCVIDTFTDPCDLLSLTTSLTCLSSLHKYHSQCNFMSSTMPTNTNELERPDPVQNYDGNSDKCILPRALPKRQKVNEIIRPDKGVNVTPTSNVPDILDPNYPDRIGGVAPKISLTCLRNQFLKRTPFGRSVKDTFSNLIGIPPLMPQTNNSNAGDVGVRSPTLTNCDNQSDLLDTTAHTSELETPQSHVPITNPEKGETCHLPPQIQLLKEAANTYFKKENYHAAVNAYNSAIEAYIVFISRKSNPNLRLYNLRKLDPSLAIIYCNRAAALIKRDWDGDGYAAMKDCFTALRLDPLNVKARFRFVKCLLEFGKVSESRACLEQFKFIFKDIIHISNDNDGINNAVDSKDNCNGTSSQYCSIPIDTSPNAQTHQQRQNKAVNSALKMLESQISAKEFHLAQVQVKRLASRKNGKTFSSQISIPNNENSNEPFSSNRENDCCNIEEINIEPVPTLYAPELVEFLTYANDLFDSQPIHVPDYVSSVDGESVTKISLNNRAGRNEFLEERVPTYSLNPQFKNRYWRKYSRDFKKRFCGHCNTTTDIKEANYFGKDGQYVIAGSDDGCFIVWDKQTTNIVKILLGDNAIVNCLQPHPEECLLATSGIDPEIRIWRPTMTTDVSKESSSDQYDIAAAKNQQRMNADPIEVMLMNLGYRIAVPPEDIGSVLDRPVMTEQDNLEGTSGRLRRRARIGRGYTVNQIPLGEAPLPPPLSQATINVNNEYLNNQNSNDSNIDRDNNDIIFSNTTVQCRTH